MTAYAQVSGDDDRHSYALHHLPRASVDAADVDSHRASYSPRGVPDAVFDATEDVADDDRGETQPRLQLASRLGDRTRVSVARFANLVGMRIPGVTYTSLGGAMPESSQSAARRARSMQRSVGGGTNDDGVFSNLNAKPDQRGGRREENDRGEDDDLAEDALPPTYEDAAADAAPTYWESTIMGGAYPSAFAEGGWIPGSGTVGDVRDMIIGELPLGSVIGFLWNFVLSVMFQFIGFLLTFFLYTTHGARLGSCAGLGITLLQYGLFLLDRMPKGGAPDEESDEPAPTPVQIRNSKIVCYAFIAVGLFLALQSLLKFLRMYRYASKYVTEARGDNAASNAQERTGAGGAPPTDLEAQQPPAGFIGDADIVTRMNSAAGRWRDLFLSELGMPVMRAADPHAGSADISGPIFVHDDASHTMHTAAGQMHAFFPEHVRAALRGFPQSTFTPNAFFARTAEASHGRDADLFPTSIEELEEHR